jgi:hypothetical protein
MVTLPAVYHKNCSPSLNTYTVQRTQYFNKESHYEQLVNERLSIIYMLGVFVT